MCKFVFPIAHLSHAPSYIGWASQYVNMSKFYKIKKIIIKCKIFNNTSKTWLYGIMVILHYVVYNVIKINKPIII